MDILKSLLWRSADLEFVLSFVQITDGLYFIHTISIMI